MLVAMWRGIVVMWLSVLFHFFFHFARRSGTCCSAEPNSLGIPKGNCLSRATAARPKSEGKKIFSEKNFSYLIVSVLFYFFHLARESGTCCSAEPNSLRIF